MSGTAFLFQVQFKSSQSWCILLLGEIRSFHTNFFTHMYISNCFMYGLLTYMHHEFQPNVGIYSIHEAKCPQDTNASSFKLPTVPPAEPPAPAPVPRVGEISPSTEISYLRGGWNMIINQDVCHKRLEQGWQDGCRVGDTKVRVVLQSSRSAFQFRKGKCFYVFLRSSEDGFLFWTQFNFAFGFQVPLVFCIFRLANGMKFRRAQAPLRAGAFVLLMLCIVKMFSPTCLWIIRCVNPIGNCVLQGVIFSFFWGIWQMFRTLLVLVGADFQK